ncbi:MAG TPA: glycosyltransferase family 39 protein [Clostridia bacterium]|nr:glycosyltransferase family 39 protein [Clostridia bacterium]
MRRDEIAPPVGAVPVHPSPGDTALTCFPSAKQLFGLFLCYYGLQVLIRTLVSSSLDLDESDQVLFSQKLLVGYGPDPPLYTWFQIVFFAILGQSVLALSLLKNLLLFSLCVFNYLNARFITRSHACGVGAAVSLLFVPQIAWESQRDLTHSVLASTLASAMLFCFLHLLRGKETRWYLLTGFCAGLGLLSKFNFGFWILGLVAAALTLREFRSALMDRRMLLALVVCLLVFLPNSMWILSHSDVAFFNADKLQMAREASTWLSVAGRGIRNVISAIATFMGPLCLVCLVLFWKAPKQVLATEDSSNYAKLLLRALGIIAGLFLLLVVCVRATGFRERWFQPMLVCSPVLVMVFLQERLDQARLTRMVAFALVVMLAVAVILPGRILLGEKLDRDERLMWPYAELAAQIRAVAPPDSIIVAETGLVGGNLRLALPTTPVTTPKYPGLYEIQGKPLVIVWDARRQDAMPEWMRNWAKAKTKKNPSRFEPQYLTATYKYRRAKQMRFGMLLLK